LHNDGILGSNVSTRISCRRRDAVEGVNGALKGAFVKIGQKFFKVFGLVYGGQLEGGLPKFTKTPPAPARHARSGRRCSIVANEVCAAPATDPSVRGIAA